MCESSATKSGDCVYLLVVVIDDVMEDKMRMLSCFTFANGAIDYRQSTKGLNMYHSRMLGAGESLFAERFFELPRKEFIELVEKVRTGESHDNYVHLTAESGNRT